MYVVKELIGTLLCPLVLALLLVGCGLTFKLLGHIFLKRCLYVSAALIGYLGSISLVGSALLSPLEHEYSVLHHDQPLPLVAYIVVLGSDYAPHDQQPATTVLDPDGLARIVEGVRLTRLLPGARLVVSGGAPEGHPAPALGYERAAGDLGVPATSLIMSDRGLNTSEESRALAQVVGQAPFILVTSAFHMPRAVRLMRLAGMNPIPAPTAQRVVELQGGAWRGLLPSAGGLQSTHLALHEYLGLLAISAGIN